MTPQIQRSYTILALTLMRMQDGVGTFLLRYQLLPSQMQRALPSQNPRKKSYVPASGSSLANELPHALTQALESAIKNMKWLAPRKERPPKQVLGLACPRKQASFDDKRKTAQKGKQSYEGKEKRPMD
jgi:hypothetical protein